MGGQAGVGGAWLPGGGRGLGQEPEGRALGLERGVTHPTLGPGTCLPSTPHSPHRPPTHCALVMSTTPPPRPSLDPLSAWGASNGSLCPLFLLEPARRAAGCGLQGVPGRPPMNIRVSQQCRDMGRITPFYSRGN